MATGQDLLDRLQILHPESQVQSGEADVANSLVVLNDAQDLFEMVVAQYPGFLGGTTGTVTTTADTESTAFPSGVVRIDGLDYIDPNTSRPAWPLVPIQRRGGHAYHNFWPFNLITTQTSGKPRGFWTNGASIFWDPLPDGTHTVRWYGFQSADDITVSGTFAYPDAVMLPLASLAVRIIRTGIDDPVQDFTALAEDIFRPLITTLTRFNRSEPAQGVYAFKHTT